MALAALKAQQAQKLAQGGDKFIFTNDAATGRSLGAAHIPLAQAQALESTLGYVPDNLTFSNGRIYAADGNGALHDVTQFVDMSSYLPHDQTTQTKADSLLQTALKFGGAALGAYGIASGLGSLTSSFLPSGTEFADQWANMPPGTQDWNGQIPTGDAPINTPTGTEADWYPPGTDTTLPPTVPPPTGTEADWYNDPTGKPIPSGSSIMPDGSLIPPGAPVPPGGVPLAPPVVPAPVTPTVPVGTTPPGTPTVPTGNSGNIDWGNVIAGIVGAVGASNMADAYKETADKYMKMGQPSRDRYEASFAPGFSMMNDPGYADAMASVGKESAAAMSMHGNPADSPNAWKQTQLDVYNKVAYPALQGYRQTNASAGGLASFASAVPAADTAAVGAQQNIWNAGGSVANNLFSPPQSNSFDLQKFAKSMGWA